MSHLDKAIQDLVKHDTPTSKNLLDHIRSVRLVEGKRNDERIAELVNEYVELTTKLKVATQVYELELDYRELRTIWAALKTFNPSLDNQSSTTTYDKRYLDRRESSSLVQKIFALMGS